MTINPWLVAFISAFLGLAGWAFRLWIKESINGSVQAKFDRELEALKSELRLREERITGLQAAALSGSAGRQSLIEKRKIEALEGIWNETLALGTFNMSARLLQVLNYDAISAAAPIEQDIREAFNKMRGGEFKDRAPSLAQQHRPFVPEQLWSTFAAYQTIMIHSYLRLEALIQGISNPERLFKSDEAIALVKAVLPHQSEYLDKFGISGIFFLVDEIRDKVLKEVRQALKGADMDAESVARSAMIMKLVRSIDQSEPLEAGE